MGRPRTLTKKLLTALKPSSEKTKTCRKRLLTSPTSSAKAENLSTSSKKLSDLLNKSETSSKLHLRKPKARSKSKKLKYFDLPSKCPRTNRTSSDESLRKKRKSTTPDETVSELSNPCRPAWTLSLNPELKPFDRRRSSKATLTTLKSNSDMPTDKLLMPARTSKFSRAS